MLLMVGSMFEDRQDMLLSDWKSFRSRLPHTVSCVPPRAAWHGMIDLYDKGKAKFDWWQDWRGNALPLLLRGHRKQSRCQ
jgi:hypothetical protein